MVERKGFASPQERREEERDIADRRRADKARGATAEEPVDHGRRVHPGDSMWAQHMRGEKDVT